MAEDKPAACAPAAEADPAAEAGPAPEAAPTTVQPTSTDASATNNSAAPSPVASSSTTPLGPDGQPLSKKAQKRLAKRAYYEATRLEKRAEERQRRKERNAYLKAGWEAGTLSPKEREIMENKLQLKRARRHKAEPYPGAIVIDLKFDELMLDAEMRSMASQIQYVYSDTRAAARPFTSVLFTGFSPESTPRLWAQMLKHQWTKWDGLYFRAEDVDAVQADLAALSVEAEEPKEPPEKKERNEDDRTTYLCGSDLPPGFSKGRQLVYLSADSEEELDTLSPEEIYIIGGIVDHNRHKMLCQNKAEKLGIRTARLPIGKYIQNLPTRKVLTVNQVFAILLQYNTLGDWAKAFEAVIPQRKYTEKKKERREKREAASKAGTEDGGVDVSQSEAGDGMDVDAANEEAAMNAGGDDEEAAINGAVDEEAAMNA